MYISDNEGDLEFQSLIILIVKNFYTKALTAISFKVVESDLVRKLAHKATKRWKVLRALTCSSEPGHVYLKSINILSAMFC